MGDPRLKELLDEVWKLHCAKQEDYGSPDDCYANYSDAEDFGIPAWKSATLRLAEKVMRLKTFVRAGKLRNESAEDSYKDIAVGALISLVLYRRANAVRSTLSGWEKVASEYGIEPSPSSGHPRMNPYDYRMRRVERTDLEYGHKSYFYEHRGQGGEWLPISEEDYRAAQAIN